MFEDETLDICRYEVGTIVNNNRNVIIATNDLEIANDYYEKTVTKLNTSNNVNHNIVFVYDYDKNTNINYYDNLVD